ncbi:FAD-dependent oxidoreductase [Candidatus Woesearchaeota archaeon]|nr:FAD-dependent oxidoreductase [Candidatus Woesearchaeota archaeon]
MVDVYETIIIGAGIAGLTAAMYASRKRMKYEIISTDFGGQFLVSGEVLNYPGIVKTTGVAFSTIMQKQMDFNGVKIKLETVKGVKKKGTGFVVTTNKRVYETKTVIMTTGSKPRKLNVPGEDTFAKKGVTYCAICDGPLFNGMEVAIMGGGDSALEAVDFMKNIASKIYLLVRGDKLIAHEYLQESVKSNDKVEVLFNAETTEILGGKLVSGIKFKQQGEEKKLAVRGVIIEIGRIPNTNSFSKLVKLDEHKHIIIDGQGVTSVPGLFAAGDCASGHEYQYAIAAGQGCMALLKAARYLVGTK